MVGNSEKYEYTAETSKEFGLHRLYACAKEGAFSKRENAVPYVDARE